MIDKIKNQLSQSLPNELVEKLIDIYILLKEHYYLEKHRSASFEGGRFAEVGIRIIQYATSGIYTGLDERLPNFHDEVIKIGNRSGFSDSFRFHIPRTLEVIHDIRNKRDVGHPKGELDANYSDATLSLFSSSWVLVELLRIYYTGNINEAQRIVNDLVQFSMPIIQDFDGFLKILDPTLPLWKMVLIWAFYKRSEGVTFDEIRTWLKERYENRYIRKVLHDLENNKFFLHSVDDRYFITKTGILEVAEKISLVVRKT